MLITEFARRPTLHSPSLTFRDRSSQPNSLCRLKTRLHVAPDQPSRPLDRVSNPLRHCFSHPLSILLRIRRTLHHRPRLFLCRPSSIRAPQPQVSELDARRQRVERGGERGLLGRFHHGEVVDAGRVDSEGTAFDAASAGCEGVSTRNTEEAIRGSRQGGVEMVVAGRY